jgi:hypothetical protein
VDGTPIHPHLAAGALGVGVLRRLVVGAASELMDLGLSVRCFPRHLADAIKTRDGGRCRMVDGCDAPHQWLDTDHIRPWSHFGPTSVGNGRCGCAPHNRKEPHPRT